MCIPEDLFFLAWGRSKGWVSPQPKRYCPATRRMVSVASWFQLMGSYHLIFHQFHSIFSTPKKLCKDLMICSFSHPIAEGWLVVQGPCSNAWLPTFGSATARACKDTIEQDSGESPPGVATQSGVWNAIATAACPLLCMMSVHFKARSSFTSLVVRGHHCTMHPATMDHWSPCSLSQFRDTVWREKEWRAFDSNNSFLASR